jgi:hypothetical protein
VKPWKPRILFVAEFRLRACTIGGKRRRATTWRPDLFMFPANPSCRQLKYLVDVRGMHDNCEYRIVPYIQSKTP